MSFFSFGEPKVDPTIKRTQVDAPGFEPINIIPFFCKLCKCHNFQLSAHFETFFNPFVCLLTRHGVPDRRAHASCGLTHMYGHDSRCLPHYMLLVKQRAYGLSDKACVLIAR